MSCVIGGGVISGGNGSQLLDCEFRQGVVPAAAAA